MTDLSHFEKGTIVGACIATASISKMAILVSVARSAVWIVMTVYTQQEKTAAKHSNCNPDNIWDECTSSRTCIIKSYLVLYLSGTDYFKSISYSMQFLQTTKISIEITHNHTWRMSFDRTNQCSQYSWLMEVFKFEKYSQKCLSLKIPHLRWLSLFCYRQSWRGSVIMWTIRMHHVLSQKKKKRGSCPKSSKQSSTNSAYSLLWWITCVKRW